MEKTLIRTFSLAALVGMTAISTNAVRAEGNSLEGAKQESGVEFGEMGGLEGRGGSLAVSAAGGGVSRPVRAKMDRPKKTSPNEVPLQRMTYETDEDVQGINGILGAIGLTFLGGLLGVAAGAAVAVGAGVGVGALVYSFSNTAIGMLGGIVATGVSGFIAVPLLGWLGGRLGRKIGGLG